LSSLLRSFPELGLRGIVQHYLIGERPP
jgi:hypothetical protein